jgi:aerotaxis receptor
VALIASTRERPFGSDEPFAFGVDRDGRLTAVDDVFARLSGLAPGAAVDAMRHPDVPYAALRAPFGAEAGAAVLRLVADDGAWFRAVVAAAPVADGWVGVGFKPSLPEPEAVAALRAAERAGADTAAPLAGLMPAMRAALVAEVAARDARPPAPRGGAPRSPVAGAAAPGAARDAAQLLTDLARRLAGYGGLSAALRRRTGSMEELAEEIRLFSLNAILAAHRLRDAAAIGAVAGLMKTRSDAAGPDILALAGDIETAFGVLEAASFRVAVGRVQAEALPGAPFVGEALAASLEAVAELVPELDGALDQLARRSTAVEEHLKTLRFLELQGRIEAARAEDTQHVRMLFEEIGKQVRAAGDELKAFAASRDRDVSGFPREARRLATAIRT